MLSDMYKFVVEEWWPRKSGCVRRKDLMHQGYPSRYGFPGQDTSSESSPPEIYIMSIGLICDSGVLWMRSILYSS
jgi:hypothetical protein